jgi:4-carboxymuconolactone decarboxylase
MNTIKRRFRRRLPRNFDIFFGKKIIRQLMLTFISLILLNLNAKAQKTIDTTAIVNSIFPRGEKVTSSNNFNGAVWLNRFISPSDSLDCIVSLVTFQPGVRTNWHTHPGGQILIVTEGVGYYQEKGKPRQIIRKGDIIKCSPGVQHWHGASPDSEFAHLVVAPDVEKGEVTSLQRVTDEEYNSLK